MTREQANSELMQIYGMLSEEKKQAIDVLMAQEDGEYITQSAGDEIRQKNYDLISRQAVQNYIAHFLSLYLQDNVREAVEAIDEVIGDMPSVDIPPEHDGCKDCKYETYPEYYYPCCECKQNYMDMWKAIPSAEPSGDAINRQAVLDMLEDINAETEGVGFYYEHYVDYVKSLPSVKPQEPKWTLVSERLPNMVAIKDFGMPSCCENCDIFNGFDRVCNITYTKNENSFDNRNDDCPLIEVEPQEGANE